MVAKCHSQLFKQVDNDHPDTFMAQVINRIWPIKKIAPKLHIAYAISVSEYFLNPKQPSIQVTESMIKFKITKYLQRLEKDKEKLNSSDEEETATAMAKEGGEEAEEGEAEKFLEGSEGEEGEEGGGEKFLEDKGEKFLEEGGEGEEEGKGDVFFLLEGHEGQEDDEYYYSSENEKKLANKLKKKYKKK